jgi:S-formylglutathione hydrolase FrmB
VGAVSAVLVVVVTAAMQVNAYFGAFPTVRVALGLPVADQVAFVSVPSTVSRPTLPVPGRPMADAWRPPGALRATGAVVEVWIPPLRSKFRVTRNAYLYLPPAYWAPNRPLLPVLLLLHGQPGAPRDWLGGGGLARMMDGFAARHHGLAPVVVLPDATGSVLGNPLCLDSRLGNAETYLADDVPDWVRAHLQVDHDTRRWAVAGMSYGGTCALQLALRRPTLFPSFVDISGQAEPTLGSRTRTVAAAFGGDMARFRAVNPADELAHRRFPRSAGMFAVGRADHTYRPQQRAMWAAARRSGVAAEWLDVDGTHNWGAWSGGLTGSLPWLGARMGLSG